MATRKDRIALPPPPGDLESRCTPLMEARQIQRLLFSRCCQEKVTDAALGLLARSWCLVADAIRELRGIPKAGQLRPDLDPVQLAKALKRSRSRRPIDLAPIAAAFGEPLEADSVIEESPANTPVTPTKPAKTTKPDQTAPTEPTEEKEKP